MWSPSKVDLIWQITNGELLNADFDEHDVYKYFQIFEKDLGALKGRDKMKHYDTASIVDILQDGESGLYCDIFYVGSQRFLIAVETSMHNVTVQSVERAETDDIVLLLSELVDYYEGIGIQMVGIEFDKGGPSTQIKSYKSAQYQAFHTCIVSRDKY